MTLYTLRTPTSSPTRRIDPRPPFPLIWSPRHSGLYLLIAGLGGAP